MKRIAILLVILWTSVVSGAEYRTANFVVSAQTPELAELAGKAAESARKRIAIEWIGKDLPVWIEPCLVTVRVGRMGTGGRTTIP